MRFQKLMQVSLIWTWLIVQSAGASPCLSVLANFSKDTGEACGKYELLMAKALSGGSCLALVAMTGLQRAETMNAAVKVLGGEIAEFDILPVVQSSVSGGGLYQVRFASLREFPMGNKMVFPCYRLEASFREACFFHQPLGGLADVCDSEYADVLSSTVESVYKQLILATGGMNGWVAGHIWVYYVMVNTLPLTSSQKGVAATFFDDFTQWTSKFPSTWAIALTVVNPQEATPNAPYNYGFPSHLPRAYTSHLPSEEEHSSTIKWRTDKNPWANASITDLVATSAGVGGAVAMLPFSLAGNNWDSVEKNDLQGSMKIIALLISFLMVKRLKHKSFLKLDYIWPGCETEGCPVIDMGVIDNGPVSITFAYAVQLGPALRPRHVYNKGSGATFSLYNYLMGHDKLDVWTSGSGVNICPFPDVSYCSTLSSLRELTKRVAPEPVLRQYTELSNSYAVWLPQNQVIADPCGDPLGYEYLKNNCEVSSFCYMPAQIVPSKRMDIKFTPDVAIVFLCILFLGATPLAKNFVKGFLPSKIFSLPAFRHMDIWFPAFSIEGKEKGGMGFFKFAAHSLMDYLTYLQIRVLPKMLEVRTEAWAKETTGVNCQSVKVEIVDKETVAALDFQKMQMGLPTST